MAATNPSNGHDKPKCGAKKRDGSGEHCKRPAGWGTSHPGTGRCRLHGGSTRDHVAHARRERAGQAVATYGLPREVDPRDALLEEVYRTAGAVDWLSAQVAALDPDAVVWGVAQEVDKMSGDNPGTDTTRKAAINVWVQLHQAERKHLREVCRDAVAAGIEERRVKLAEQQGAMLASVVRGILNDIPDEEREAIRGRICQLYRRLGEAFDEDLICPWERDDDASADHMVASAWAEFDALPPLPADWFAEPTVEALPPESGGMHITDQGRIYGWVAQRGVPHEGFPGRHLTIDDLQPIDTSFFLRKQYRLDDGTSLPLGPFVMNVGHHRDGGNCETQACLWDDSKTIAGLITVEFNDRGMWFSGAAAPWLSQWDQAAFLACQPSYHMVERPEGGYKLGSVLAVPRPGHPSRLAASAFVARSNMALTPAPAPTLLSTSAAAVPVQPVDVQALAVAVVDEQERRHAARAEIEAMNAELAQIRAEVAQSMLAEIQGGS